MYSVKVINRRGQELEITQREDRFQIISIKGLSQPSAKINLSGLVGVDGARYNSGKLNTRNIVLMLKITGDVEANRQDLYIYFATKEICRFYFRNGARDVWIDGYVENCEVDLFANQEIMQISIICPDPYFKGVDLLVDDISKTIAAFTFPFSIDIGEPVVISELNVTAAGVVFNASESDSGMLLRAFFTGHISRIRFIDTDTAEFFEVVYPFMAGDELDVNTVAGEKSVFLIREAERKNLIGYATAGSTFFQLLTGENHISYIADEGSGDALVMLRVEHRTLYRGV